ncbi:MAG: hypothetical protein QN194_15395 [Armatimonadota bacterium]|nr:hypothetical protein [Armatimonadota bacterium]
MVEIELDPRLSRAIGPALAVAALMLAALLAVAGRSVTPVDAEGRPRILSYGDWQALKAERAFRAERDRLRRAAEELAHLLEARPDPVRAMLLRDRILRETAGGHPALERARERVRAAAALVAAWASGGASREEAVRAVQAAVEALR